MENKGEEIKINNSEKFLHQLLKLGEMMMCAGAEVNRVEDTVSRMGRAYGASKMNVFAITSSIIVTMTLPDGRELTQTRRIHKQSGADFTRLEALNELSRKFCTEPMQVDTLAEELEHIRHEKPKKAFLLLGSALAGGSFALFFGGGMQDGAAAAVFGLIIGMLQLSFEKYCINKVIFNLICSLAVGVGICAAAKLFPVFNADKIIIGDIMLLIPGVAMTNAVRDILVGDTISGVMRLTETILWAASLACGFIVAILLIGI